MEKKEELDWSEIYGNRVLVFLEVSPQSNKYHQVLLSTEMYKTMTATISKKISDIDGNIEETEITTSEEVYELPDLSDVYSNV